MADLAKLDQIKADLNKYNQKGALQGMVEKSPRRWYGRLVTKIIYQLSAHPFSTTQNYVFIIFAQHSHMTSTQTNSHPFLDGDSTMV